LRTWEPWGRFFFCAAKPVPQNRMHPRQAKPGRQKTNFFIPEDTFTTALKNVHNYDGILYKEGGVLFMPQIRPITDLRNTNEISDACHAVKEPSFITKKGYGDLVVMTIETYEQIVETQFIDNAIAEAEEEYERTGILLDVKETLAGLRRRHFG